MELGWEVVRNCGGQRGGLSLDTVTWVCLGPDSPLNGTLPELFPQMHTVCYPSEQRLRKALDSAEFYIPLCRMAQCSLSWERCAQRPESPYGPERSSLGEGLSCPLRDV